MNTTSSSFNSPPEFASSLLRSSQSNPSLKSIPRSSSPSSSPESRPSSISMSSRPLQIVNSNNSQVQPSLPPRPKSINSIENFESRSSSVSLNSSGGFTKSTFLAQSNTKGGPPPLPSRSNSVGSDLDEKDTGMTRSASGNSLKASTAGLSQNRGHAKENQNPFEDYSTVAANPQRTFSKPSRDQCPIPLPALKRYIILFNEYAERSASSSVNTIAGATVKTIWAKSRLNFDVLAKIWRLVSTNQKEELVREEFVVGVWLIDEVLRFVISLVSLTYGINFN
ncbi:hypothetical protein BKA69DRAFT_515770 [Paraphysoderma sedebokerense]|nr:hypothetical protein BKA69DRAFT_515770 [Paraphysoderma sedebokerense]